MDAARASGVAAAKTRSGELPSHDGAVIEMDAVGPHAAWVRWCPGGIFGRYDLYACRRDGVLLARREGQAKVVYPDGEHSDLIVSGVREDDVVTACGNRHTGKRRVGDEAFAVFASVMAAVGATDESDGRVLYCGVCADFLPSDDGRVCDHVHWCERCGMYTGPGCDEACRCAAHARRAPGAVAAKPARMIGKVRVSSSETAADDETLGGGPLSDAQYVELLQRLVATCEAFARESRRRAAAETESVWRVMHRCDAASAAGTAEHFRGMFEVVADDVWRRRHDGDAGTQAANAEGHPS